MKKISLLLAVTLVILASAAFAGQDWRHRYFPDPERHEYASQANAAYTATVTSASFNLAGAKELLVTYDITAVSGTSPTETLELELSIDGSTWWVGGSFSAKTAVGTEKKGFATPAVYGRWKRTIGGTSPSFTETVTAEFRR